MRDDVPRGHGAPDDALWSVTACGADKNLIPNRIDRSSISDRSPGIRENSDGGTTSYFKNKSPGAEYVSNWHQAGSGLWFPILRLHIPTRRPWMGRWSARRYGE